MTEPTLEAGAGENPTTQSGAEESGSAGFHPAQLRKSEAARKAAEKRLQEAEARLAELEPRAGLAQRYEEMISGEVDTLLADLPSDAQQALSPILAKLSDPFDRREAIRAFSSVAAVQSARPANVARGAPPRPGPTLENLRANPDKLKTLPREEREAVLRELGVKTGRKGW